MAAKENKKTGEISSIYEPKRDFYISYKYYKSELQSNIFEYRKMFNIPEEIIIFDDEDEFDDELKYGTNATEGLRVNGIKYDDFINNSENMEDEHPHEEKNTGKHR